jgi:hypothetical protein
MSGTVTVIGNTTYYDNVIMYYTNYVYYHVGMYVDYYVVAGSAYLNTVTYCDVALTQGGIPISFSHTIIMQ